MNKVLKEKSCMKGTIAMKQAHLQESIIAVADYSNESFAAGSERSSGRNDSRLL